MQSSSKNAGLQVPLFPIFSPLSIVGREVYEKHVHSYEPYSDYGYTSLHVWSRNHEHLVSKLNGNLVLSMHGYMDGKKMLSFIGTNDVNLTASTLFDYLDHQEDYMADLFLIPEMTATAISSPELLVNEDRDNHDYILSTPLFHEVPGPGFSHMRRKISQFIRNYDGQYDIHKLDLNDTETRQSILKLSYEWAFMGTEGSISAHEEIAAITRLLKDFAELNNTGGIHTLGLMLDGGLQGFCVYEIHGEYATVHFIKANLAYNGTADFVMMKTMQKIHKDHGVLHVNHEQDLGIMGLRAAKKRYCPTGYLKKYTITKSK